MMPRMLDALTALTALADDAMVHRIVSDYSGEVKVNSTRGAGTTVQVRFPAGVGAAVN